MARVEPVCSEPKVFVGQIPPEVSRDDIAKLFQQYGNVTRCNLITGPDGRSRGCAMVLYATWTEAENAVEAQNGTLSLGGTRPLVVKFADPPKKSETGGPIVGVAPKKLFIGQVPAQLTDAELRQLFSPYGNIVELHMLRKEGAPGCAFVTYSRWSEAEQAMNALSGNHTLPGAKSTMVVKFADAKIAGDSRSGDKRPFGGDMTDGPNKKAYMGGLGGLTGYMGGMGGGGMGNYGMGGAMGGAMGGGMGGVNPIAAGYGADMSGMGLGSYGAGLNNGIDMQQALALGGGIGGLGRGGMAGPRLGSGIKDEAMKSWKLFVGQVPFNASEQDLWPIFQQYGEICELIILRQNPGGRSKGCAFVTYSTRESAEAAMQGVTGKVVPGDARNKNLMVKFANAK